MLLEVEGDFYILAVFEIRCPKRTTEFVFLRELCFSLGKGLAGLFGVIQGKAPMGIDWRKSKDTTKSQAAWHNRVRGIEESPR